MFCSESADTYLSGGEMKVPPWCRMVLLPQGITVEVVSERARPQRVADFKKDWTFLESAREVTNTE